MKSKKTIIKPSLSKNNQLIIVVSATVLIAVIAFAFLRDKSILIDATSASTMIETGVIEKAVVEGPYVYLQESGQVYRVPKDALNMPALYRSTSVEIREPNPYLADLLTLLALLVILVLVLRWAKKSREQRDQQVNQQIQFANELEKISDIRPIVSNLTFNDVAGISEVREELEEIIDFLRNPLKYTHFGIRMPRGVLLIGPPGVGKTLIAKAVAGEARVPFFYQSGASFVQIYVGMGAKRVRELFKRAKVSSPAIVFIDEIDAVGKARGGMRNDEREATLNQLLTEMDGFEDSSGIIVIAATNKIEMLDEALLRPGRFDRRIFVSLPNKEERKDILNIYLGNKPHRLNMDEIARMTVGFSGAALSSLANEAAINALRNNKKIIETADFEAVKEKVLLGKRKILTYSDEERRLQATYQAAKALTAYWLDVDFEKISLLGNTFKNTEKELVSRTELFNKIKVYLSGSVMLNLKKNEIYTNAVYDLNEAKRIAQEMVEQFGMGTTLLADVNQTAQILEDARNECAAFLGKMDRAVISVEDELLKNEVIGKREIKALLSDLF